LKTYEEFRADFVRIVPTNDVRALRTFAVEVQALGTQRSEALSAHALGISYCITGPYADALEHLTRAKELYLGVGDQGPAANVTSSLGTVHAQMGQYADAMDCYQHALALQEELGNREGEAVALDNIASLMYHTGAYAEAIEYSHRSLQLFEERGDQLRQASVLNSIGIVFNAMSNYPSALEYFRQSLAVYEELGHRGGIGTVIGNIGNVYFDTGSYPEALDHMLRALEAHKAEGNSEFVANVTGNVGNVYRATGSYSEALAYYQEAQRQLIELEYPSGIASGYANMADVYWESGDADTALDLMQKALTIFQELGDRAGVARATGSIARWYLENGDLEQAGALLDQQADTMPDNPSARLLHTTNRALLSELQGNLEQAHQYLQDALTIAQEVQLKAKEASVRQQLRELAHKRNDFAAYIEHNTEYAKITEEIKGKEATQRLALMEAERKVEAELQKRDKERALLYGALPESVASRMLAGEDVSGDHFDQASVLFLDIVGFTSISDRIPPRHVVHLLKAIFRVCDDVCKRHGMTKIKTIGDSYMAAAGVPVHLGDHAQRAAITAIDIMKGLNDLELTMDPALGDTSWTKDIGEIRVRIGLHSGPVVAGIVGDQRLQYDVWGDTVNTASRMESTGEPGRIQVSESFAQGLGINGEGQSEEGMPTALAPRPYSIAPRGAIEIKGKGTMTTYWLEAD